MASQPSNSGALLDGLRYYLLRSDAMGGSVMVPLVPVDQLPFQLQGIPRRLTHRQISDEGWKLCSETNEVSSALAMQAPITNSFLTQPSPTTSPQYLAPDHHVRAGPQMTSVDYYQPTRLFRQSPTVANSAQSLALVKSPDQRRPTPSITLESPLSLTDTFASIYPKDAKRLGYRLPHPSGIEPDPSKKEYCTHWIQTGECSFAAMGCKFKHEMPGIEKLRELGFVRGIPRWWKEKTAIVSRPPTWMQRRLAGNEDAEYAGEVPEPREFPDPSTLKLRATEGRDLFSEEVQQPRSILKRDLSTKQTTAGCLTPPAAIVKQPTRCASHMPDLLIDLDDAPTPSPSPQSSCTSAASLGLSKAQIPSSNPSASPLSLPILDRNPSVLTAYKAPSKAPSIDTPDRESSTRRHSEHSWTSNTEDDAPISTSTIPNVKVKLPRPTQERREPHSRNTNDNKKRLTTTHTTPTHTALTKPQSGLASSKHATITFLSDSSRNSSTKINAAKNSSSRNKNANRKGYSRGGVVDGP
ncbi:hypothetical protein GT037_001536 [Alternaria burnsii]|uniref:C3H1-type domain-containing protein n=1 Tax=Alternaria burnsii TaxID=1187904 RepID=A0A8H7BD44_9PLEO|nr:uncharacterized protein GT037_001536 [Alternaria burnsii]KAF7679885.1 hypothetical protein GT037_001536 [Alternaria burnsii]